MHGQNLQSRSAYWRNIEVRTAQIKPLNTKIMKDAIDTLRDAVRFYNDVDEHINTRFKTTEHMLLIFQFCRDTQCGINDVGNEAFVNLIGYNPTN